VDLRLVTLNMRFGAGSRILDRPAYDVPFSTRKLSPIADALESVEPDIVALQEVSNPRLAKLLKMGCAYMPQRSSYAFDFFEWITSSSNRRPLKSGKPVCCLLKTVRCPITPAIFLCCGTD